jgi:hypothetical protein
MIDTPISTKSKACQCPSLSLPHSLPAWRQDNQLVCGKGHICENKDKQSKQKNDLLHKIQSPQPAIFYRNSPEMASECDNSPPILPQIRNRNRVSIQVQYFRCVQQTFGIFTHRRSLNPCSHPHIQNTSSAPNYHTELRLVAEKMKKVEEREIKVFQVISLIMIFIIQEKKKIKK